MRSVWRRHELCGASQLRRALSDLLPAVWRLSWPDLYRRHVSGQPHGGTDTGAHQRADKVTHSGANQRTHRGSHEIAHSGAQRRADDEGTDRGANQRTHRGTHEITDRGANHRAHQRTNESAHRGANRRPDDKGPDSSANHSAHHRANESTDGGAHHGPDRGAARHTDRGANAANQLTDRSADRDVVYQCEPMWIRRVVLAVGSAVPFVHRGSLLQHERPVCRRRILLGTLGRLFAVWRTRWQLHTGSAGGMQLRSGCHLQRRRRVWCWARSQLQQRESV